MSQNNDQKNRKGPKRNGQNGGNNWRGVVSLVSWALLLTIIVSYVGNWISGSESSTSVEISYTEFVTLIENNKIAKVEFDPGTGLAHITPAVGFTYTDKDGKTYGPMPKRKKARPPQRVKTEKMSIKWFSFVFNTEFTIVGFYALSFKTAL